MAELEKNRVIDVQLTSHQDTEKLGFTIANLVPDRLLITLEGPLGAGKTTFSQGAAQALEVEELVNSPTFTMLNEYHSGRLPLYHFDLYRLKDEFKSTPASANARQEALETELQEISSGHGLILIEWPDVLENYLNELDHLRVQLNYSKAPLGNDVSDDDPCRDSRTARIAASGSISSTVLDELANVYFS